MDLQKHLLSLQSLSEYGLREVIPPAYECINELSDHQKHCLRVLHVYSSVHMVLELPTLCNSLLPNELVRAKTGHLHFHFEQPKLQFVLSRTICGLRGNPA